MYWKPQKPSSRDEDKFKIQPNSTRTNCKKFLVCGTILFLIWWFVLPYHLQRSLTDVEEIVERLVRDNPETLPEITDLGQDEPAVIDFVKKHYVFKPESFKSGQIQPPPTFQNGLVDYLTTKKLINTKEPGYFIEVGTHNGTGFTSTISLDKDFGWSGLVVEPVSNPFKTMLQARKQQNKREQNEAVVSQATISAYPYITLSKFYYNPNIDVWGGLNFRFYKETSSSVTVLCIPLYSLLLASNIPQQVDLLILDIEGNELEVLKTLPLDKMQISLIVAETCNGEEGPTAVQDFLQEKGYQVVGKLKVPFGKELTAKVSGIIKREDVFSEYTIFKR